MRERPISEKFWPMLRRVSLASALLKLVAIPVNLIHARLLSGVVTAATAGQIAVDGGGDQRREVAGGEKTVRRPEEAEQVTRG